ncbi:agarase [Lutibacter citreus]|uniref:agarase n=1 Tax=Lutibacter citreus TaxID=2138210 RepID=UPI00130097FC|nr:agarase [Lutibacter citreus]
MMKHLIKQMIVLCAYGFAIISHGQNNEMIWADQKQKELFNFESKNILYDIEYQKGTSEIVGGEGVTLGHKALKVTFKGDESTSGVSLKPKSPWITNEFKNFCLVFDATNLTDVSVQLHVGVESVNNENISRSVALPSRQTKTYYLEAQGKSLGEDYGLRDDPVAFKTEAVKMLINGWKYNLNFSEISKIKFFVKSNFKDKTVVLDNIRLVESPETDPDYLKNIVDKYGQSNKLDFPLKVKSDKELRQIAEKELRELAVSKPMPDRSTYGGWKDGPKLKATGFFRTEKVGKKWALVDPEGYLFFSTGIANARMANTTTFTGIDYKNDSVRYVDPEDVTPEDSKGIVTLNEKITNTAYRAYPNRNDMFVGLPDYNDPLANHYSYRRETHKGPVKHGETYSFYQANLERKYGEQYPGSYILKWRDITIDRMLDWGFTSFGNWAAEDFYGSKRMPYFANGWIIGDFKTLSKGYWGAMPDPFDPEFARRAKQSIEVVADEVKGNPWCIGVFIDNEKSWGNHTSPKERFIIAIDALKKNAKEQPTKAVYMKLLKEKYKNIKSLSKSWGIKINSWNDLAKGVAVDNNTVFSKGLLDDLAEMTVVYASEYFRIVNEELKEKLPNHLYMGVRFTPWGMTAEVRQAAAKYIDVFSINYYRESIGKKSWGFLEKLDKPAIIGEYHIGALDTGLFHPGIVHATNQEDRARMYKQYTGDVIDNPYFVGAHWFQYTDSPISGRAHDGENYNVGFVTGTDIPYPQMVKAAKELHENLYTRRFGDLKKEKKKKHIMSE